MLQKITSIFIALSLISSNGLAYANQAAHANRPPTGFTDALTPGGAKSFRSELRKLAGDFQPLIRSEMRSPPGPRGVEGSVHEEQEKARILKKGIGPLFRGLVTREFKEVMNPKRDKKKPMNSDDEDGEVTSTDFTSVYQWAASGFFPGAYLYPAYVRGVAFVFFPQGDFQTQSNNYEFVDDSWIEPPKPLLYLFNEAARQKRSTLYTLNAKTPLQQKHGLLLFGQDEAEKLFKKYKKDKALNNRKDALQILGRTAKRQEQIEAEIYKQVRRFKDDAPLHVEVSEPNGEWKVQVKRTAKKVLKEEKSWMNPKLRFRSILPSSELRGNREGFFQKQFSSPSILSFSADWAIENEEAMLMLAQEVAQSEVRLLVHGIDVASDPAKRFREFGIQTVSDAQARLKFFSKKDQVVTMVSNRRSELRQIQGAALKNVIPFLAKDKTAGHLALLYTLSDGKHPGFQRDKGIVTANSELHRVMSKYQNHWVVEIAA